MGVTDNSQRKAILPFDPRGVPKLIVANIKTEFGSLKDTVLGFKNLPAGTKVYSPVSGEAMVSTRASKGGIAAAIQDKADNAVFTLYAAGDGAQSIITPNQEPINLKIGSPLFALGSKGYAGYPEDPQLVYLFSTTTESAPKSIDRLLTKNGKIVFVVKE